MVVAVPVEAGGSGDVVFGGVSGWRRRQLDGVHAELVVFARGGHGDQAPRVGVGDVHRQYGTADEVDTTAFVGVVVDQVTDDEFAVGRARIEETGGDEADGDDVV